MIANISIQKKTLHFRIPLTIAYERVEKAEIIVIKITDEEGNYGLGSAASDSEVTGENIPELLRLLRTKLTKSFFTLPLSQWYRYHEKVQSVFAGFPSAQSAVEEAALNLFAKQAQISLTDLFGGDYRKSCPAIITIGIKSAQETIKEVNQRIKEGFKILKLKCGRDLKGDIRRIRMVKGYIPKKGKLVVDVNQGYTFHEAERFLKEIRPLQITFVEQPIAASNIGGLKRLHLSTNIPILADESVVTVEDAVDLMVNNYIDGVNIKLMKCGGTINFLKIFHLAKTLNKIIMIGCMYESNISITTGAHLALALPIDYVDLDSGHLDFYDDPARGGASIKNGKIVLKKPLTLNE